MSSSECQTSFEELHSVAAAFIRRDGIRTHRDRILEIGVVVGRLCSLFLGYAAVDVSGTCGDEMMKCMGELLWALLLAAETCHMDLGDCILKKISLNGRKYPVDLVKGSTEKYTAYSKRTAITKTEGQSTRDLHVEGTKTVEEITHRIDVFAAERLWSKFHTPRNLVLAIMGEVGELAELFQWRGDGPGCDLDTWLWDDMDHLGQEFADVAIYLLRLADVCYVSNIGSLVLLLHGNQI